MSKEFKNRKKPVRPARHNKTHRVSLYEGMSLQEVVDAVDDPATAYFETDLWDRYDRELYFYYTAPQSMELYKAALKSYGKKYLSWYKWYKTNEDKIKEALKSQKEKRAEKEKRALETRRAKLEKERQKIERKLKKMDG